ncbi:MAG: tyrosine-type recombinase/integrase [Acidimicrobiales bacterium]
MTTLAPSLQAFFTTRLGTERDVSPHTIDSYRHTFRLLLTYAKGRTGKTPSKLEFGDLDAALVSGFLDYLEHDRDCAVSTRNTRLAAVHSFFRFASYRHPEYAETIGQVLAIPQKKTESRPRSFLSAVEMEALLAAPDRNTWTGRRDHVLLALALQAGLRLSELTGLRCQDVELSTGAHVKCLGKGRKRRDTPLDKTTVSLLRTWLRERGGGPEDPLFPSRQSGRLSSDAVQRLVAKHVAAARTSCPSIESKRISAHNLRHSCAMDLLSNGVDVATLALWLGHEKLDSVNAYVHADLTMKERALERRSPLKTRTGRYRPSDTLLAFLEGL